MRIKFQLNGTVREGTLLAASHENAAVRHTLLVGMEELNDPNSYKALVYIRPSQVIERIPEEGDEVCVGGEKEEGR